MRSTWKYSRHLYVRIQRQQGTNISIHSINVILLIFPRNRENQELDHDEDEDEEELLPKPLGLPYDDLSGCCRGMILMVRGAGIVDPEAAVEERNKSLALGDA